MDTAIHPFIHRPTDEGYGVTDKVRPLPYLPIQETVIQGMSLTLRWRMPLKLTDQEWKQVFGI